MNTKRPIVTGTFQCSRAPYKGFETKRAQPPLDAHTATLLEFIEMGAIGWSGRSLKDIELITPNEAFVELVKMSPLALFGGIEEWKKQDKRTAWLSELSKYKMLSYRKHSTLGDFKQFSKNSGGMFEFAYKAKILKEPAYVRAFRQCKVDYVNLHRLIYQLLAPTLLLKQEPTRFRFHFDHPDYSSFCILDKKWRKQSESLDNWMSSLNRKIQIREEPYGFGFLKFVQSLDVIGKEHLYLSGIIVGLIKHVLKAFTPYSDKYISLGQLKITFCPYCGAIIRRRRLNHCYCNGTCRQSHSRANPDSIE